MDIKFQLETRSVLCRTLLAVLNTPGNPVGSMILIDESRGKPSVVGESSRLYCFLIRLPIYEAIEP